MGASIIAKNPPTKTSNTFHLFTHLDKNKCSPTWPEMWHVFLFTPTTSRHMRSGDEVVWKNDEPNPPTKPPVRWVINLLYKSSSMDGNEWSWWFNQTISQICSHILLANGVRKIAITKVPSAAYHIHNWVVLEIGVLQKSLISFLEMTNFCMNLKSPILRKTDNCPKQLHLLHCIPQYPNIFFFSQFNPVNYPIYHSHAIFQNFAPKFILPIFHIFFLVKLRTKLGPLPSPSSLRPSPKVSFNSWRLQLLTVLVAAPRSSRSSVAQVPQDVYGQGAKGLFSDILMVGISSNVITSMS